MLRINFLRCVALMMLASLANGQQCSTHVPVNAFDSHTRAFLFGLTPADFEATLGHSKLTITGVKPIFRNRVLVLLDVGNRPQRKSLEDVVQLVTQAPPGMPVAVGIFAQHAEFTRGFISENDLLSSSVDRLVQQAGALGPGSDFRHALRKALDLFGPHQAGDTILLVTSGNEHESKRAFAQLRQEFRRHGTRLQLLAGLLPPVADQTNDASGIFSAWLMPVPETFSDRLITLANSTGGALMGIMNSDWPEAATSGYMLSVVTPVAMKVPRSWSLRIRDAGNDVPPADLFYPEQLSPCVASLVAAIPAKTKPRP
ncbi:MAG TPA: hypothetical protein VJV96_09000 [Candidatus Angelobacter sp.]|nr:hypothetical protein [Candidatus Angelobacter sp.]